MAAAQTKVLPNSIVVPHSDGKSSLKGMGVPSQSDQSSNSSGCSQGFQYLTNGSELLSAAASANPVTGISDMNQMLVSSANSGACGSSLTTGGSSAISGNSNLQQSVNMNGDSMASSGAASMGLPASPLSFSSSNMSLPGSSGLGCSSLSHSMVTPVTRFDAQQDPSIQPAKLMKVDTALQHADESGRQSFQDHAHLLGSRQVTGLNVSGLSTGQHLSRFGHQYKGQGLMVVDQDLQSNDQHSQLHASIPGAQTLRNDLLQLQAQQNIFQRPNALMTAQLQRQEAMQHQSQLVQAQLLQQQRLLQQEQILRMMPPQVQRSRMLQQQQQQQQQIQQLQQQIAGLAKQSLSGPSGACARRLMQLLQHQRMRPTDNNIGFWREFVSEYFAPHSRKRWCLSQCTSGNGRQPTGVFPQDLWRCEICGSNPGRGFEAMVEVMPRLWKSKFDNGELEELLFVDLPHEYKLSSGLTVLEYGKAIQESVFEHLRVVWDGQLRVIFTPDLKILSWDFCARSHEELLPRRTVVPQVNQLVTLASKYQSAMAQTNGNGLSAQDLIATCNMFVSTARQLGKSLEPPFVNELGFTKRFVRCIQIAEVVNSMKDLIDFSCENKMGPIESLEKFPRRKRPEEVTNVLLQADPTAVTPYLMDEQNETVVNPVQLNMGKQASTLSRPVNGQTNPLPPLQTFLRRNSKTLIPSESSAMGTLSSGGSLSNTMQASPTSSLTSFQSSVTSLSSNQQTPLSSFQNPLSASSGNSEELQQSSLETVQCNQQNPSNTVQHLMQGMSRPQLSGGVMFRPHTENEMLSGISTLPNHGLGGLNPSSNPSSLGGVHANYMTNMGAGSGMSFQQGGHNRPQIGNISPQLQSQLQGGRLNFASLAAQHEYQLQDDSLKQTLGFGVGFGGNDVGSHPYDWK